MDELKKATSLRKPVTIVVTGASSEICRILTFMISKGQLLGETTPLVLYLVENKLNMDSLKKGTLVELQMCHLSLVYNIVCTDDFELAVSKADYIFLVHGVLSNPHYTRRDLLSSNALEYKNVGITLEKVQNLTAKILIVTEPQNINMAVCCHFAPSLDPQNITGLARLDHNRSVAKLAKMLATRPSDVTHLSVWGNIGIQAFPDIRHAFVRVNGKQMRAYDAVGNDHYLKYDFVNDIMTRSEEVYQKRHAGASLTMANAAVQHMKDWIHGTPKADFTSMIVVSDGSYEIPEGIPFSFPVKVSPEGQWEIVQDLDLDLFEKERLEEAKEGVVEEKLFADTVLGIVELKTDEEGVPPKWSFGAGKVVPCRVLGAVERDRMLLF